eukprot:7253600-Prymnesium_polylepis.1
MPCAPLRRAGRLAGSAPRVSDAAGVASSSTQAARVGLLSMTRACCRSGNLANLRRRRDAAPSATASPMIWPMADVVAKGGI